jgi:hypothetical protein
MNLETIDTEDLMAELIRRGETDTDNEGQYIVYTGMYEKETA